ncbi:hypothetical protein [Pajaroellobacter abortibovis]|uniref:Uncharacterized protein n=1 Tax=Pajaroellobacter abortibovis TaxID=1882918 RepID=A0A1L6MXE8_9BACT|nr:hypothetical protein [Pajaroellobacter abortibovis]APS00126.1 hypothetical protein BCY86_05105 [Pajaroellobacter abortibovis]
MTDEKKSKVNLPSRQQQEKKVNNPPLRAGSRTFPPLPPSPTPGPLPRTSSLSTKEQSAFPRGKERIAEAGARYAQRPPKGVTKAPLGDEQNHQTKGGRGLPSIQEPGFFPPVDPMDPIYHRIQLDDKTIEIAKKGARKRGFTIGLVVALLVAIVAYVSGRALERGFAMHQSQADAIGLAEALGRAKDEMQMLADQMEKVRDVLVKENRIPPDLIKVLAAAPIDFEGGVLVGRRFIAFSRDTMIQLVELVTGVQGFNKRKTVMSEIMQNLSKALDGKADATPSDLLTIAQIALLGKDPQGNPSAVLAPLAAPLAIGPRTALPDQFSFLNDKGIKTNIARYKKGDITNHSSALHVDPKSVERVCAAGGRGTIAQISAQVNNILEELCGNGTSGGTVLQAREGLIKKADTLIQALHQVGKGK